MPDETLYCICRSSDCKRFMIGCDKCDEWFHGDCVDLSAKAAKFVEKYFCRKCIDKDPSLQITYKPGKKPSLEDFSRKKSGKTKRDVSRGPSMSSKGSSEGSGLKNYGDEGSGTKSSTESDASSSSDEEEWNGQVDGRGPPHIDIDRRSGGPSKSKKLTKTKSKGESRQRQPSGTGVNGKKKATTKPPTIVTSRPSGDSAPNTAAEHTKTLSGPQDWESIMGMPPPLPVPPEESQNQALGPAPAQPKSDIKNLPKIGKKSPYSSHHLRRYSPRRSPSREDPDDHWPGFDWDNLRQCFGPKCRQAAAPGSKYCSDECGRALARKRLLEFMPTRLDQMGNQNYAATQLNQKEMDMVRKKLIDCKNTLENITARKTALELAIVWGKRVEPVSQEEEDQQEDVCSDNNEVSCVTCGLPQSLRTAVKHFEKCFNRYENQTSYGSLVPTPNSIFCDIQNPKTKTWCKRLKVLCPEHFRESAEDNAGVCGFPLTDEVFRSSGKYCHSLKKNCSKHPSWERVKRAELDLEILRAYIKMEELAEQEATLMRTIQSRGGIVQSLLNYTIIHKESLNGSGLNGSFEKSSEQSFEAC